MSMVQQPCSVERRALCQRSRVASIGAIVLAALLTGTATAPAQQPPVHYRPFGSSSPGAIGTRQLERGGPLRGYFQPVRILAPPGVQVSLATSGQFDDPQPAPRDFGLLIGPVYRLRVTGIHLAEGREVFPTIEVIDRLYPPKGQERRFPIPIELTHEELTMALEGKFVTRVIYLEDPRTAIPIESEYNWFDAGPGADPLQEADLLGKPVAILRMGGRLPLENAPGGGEFTWGGMPAVRFPPRPTAEEIPGPIQPAPRVPPPIRDVP